MKNRMFVRRLFEMPKTGFAALAVCGAFFVIGCVLGNVFAGTVGSEDGAAKAVAEMLTSERDCFPGFSELFLTSLKYSAAVFLLGLSLFGLAAVPALVALRGFGFSFTTALAVRVLGASEILPVFLILGVPALITVPLFLTYSVMAMCSSWGLVSASVPRLNSGGRVIPPGYFACFILNAVLIAVSSAISRYLIFDFLI